MVSALGINIQLVFAIAFFVGSRARGLRRRARRHFAGLAPGQDSRLPAVLAGRRDRRRHGLPGRRRDRRAAARPGRRPTRPCTCRRATRTTRSCSPSRCSCRARGAAARAVREARMNRFGHGHAADRVGRASIARRGAARAGRVDRLLRSVILTKALWLGGIAASSLIFLAGYGGMVSLAQAALVRRGRLDDRQPRRRRRRPGSRLEPVARGDRRARRRRLVGLGFGAIAAAARASTS